MILAQQADLNLKRPLPIDVRYEMCDVGSTIKRAILFELAHLTSHIPHQIILLPSRV